ncbi:MAG: hypothetical protein HN759_00510 [Akkermansiaceae bacterium]|nr:hypothetical protein [Akkermansiaceae bacterium]
MEIVDDTQVGNIELDVRDAGAQVITHPGRRSIEGQQATLLTATIRSNVEIRITRSRGSHRACRPWHPPVTATVKGGSGQRDRRDGRRTDQQDEAEKNGSRELRMRLSLVIHLKRFRGGLVWKLD